MKVLKANIPCWTKTLCDFNIMINDCSFILKHIILSATILIVYFSYNVSLIKVYAYPSIKTHPCTNNINT
jgi:hypothetical protein